MQPVVKILFWSAFLIILYTYLGYPLLLYIIVKIKAFLGWKRASPQPPSAPAVGVSLVIAAYNEEDIIEDKIRNTLELDYPSSLMDIIFISDGSTDRTPEIIATHPSIRLLHEPQRKGKLAAMNRAASYARHPYIIFSDANSLLNRDCVTQIIRHYSEPGTGGVAGEKRISPATESGVAAGEGLYWKYESAIKRLDAELLTTVGAAGELFSIRTELYEPLPEDTVIEDFVQSLRLCMKGYRVAYEPLAIAEEKASVTLSDELERKVRISAGAFQAMGMLKPLFNIARFPVLSFQFISHRALRWTLCPLALVIFFISSIALWQLTQKTGYLAVCIAQIVFYAAAALGGYFAKRNIRLPLAYTAFYFAFMNLCVFAGFLRFMQGKQTAVWSKAARKAKAA